MVDASCLSIKLRLQGIVANISKYKWLHCNDLKTDIRSYYEAILK